MVKRANIIMAQVIMACGKVSKNDTFSILRFEVGLGVSNAGLGLEI